MSAMSRLAEELTMNWQETHEGYKHLHSDLVILWWNSNRENVSLYHHVGKEWFVVLHSVSLLEAVDHVLVVVNR